MNSMAKHKLFLLLPILLFISVPPPLSCGFIPAVPEESPETPLPRIVNIRDEAHGVVNLQARGWNREQTPATATRKLLQTGSPPLSVSHSGRLCLLFRARKLAVRYRNHSATDLTQRTFGPAASVDTRDSACSGDRATLSLRFGDVENLKGLVIRLEVSHTIYESAGQSWFTLDSVQIHYDCELGATFLAPTVYAPVTHSYHCPAQPAAACRTATAPLTGAQRSPDEQSLSPQIQAFDVPSERFSSARDCAAMLSPAVAMGLVSSLILLLVLAYALHMVVHLKHIDRYEEHKSTIYFPRSPDAQRTDKSPS
ncbi:hypothetical protein AAFF_G00295330 [Aldrovandia affinis]|uniref:Uncharacterized protein n=1 Tax=Aldrovandia affinis TaxID=143900 RepID=A0AAD7R8S3_9TELE|nr:hypothetical protein AAFF_G00295330 [Aldrovandia affinis]